MNLFIHSIISFIYLNIYFCDLFILSLLIYLCICLYSYSFTYSYIDYSTIWKFYYSFPYSFIYKVLYLALSN